MNWYIKMDNQQYGPYLTGDLLALHQKGDFKRDTPVWVYQKDGWDWVRAEDVVELSEIFLPSTPEKKGAEGVVPGQDIPMSHSSLLSDKVWAVAGGKGGVGKSLLASSLAIGLTVLGKRVILVDLDLGGENLHTLFGIKKAELTIHDFLMGGVAALDDLVQKTSVERLFLISGQTGALGNANILHMHKQKLLSGLRKLDCDYLILDIGAGTAYNQLDFFLEADHGIVVTMPEPHAIQDAFNFVKTALFRKIARTFREDPVLEDYFKARKHFKIEKIETFLEDMKSLNFSRIHELTRLISSFYPKIILNQVMDRSEFKDGDFFVKSLKEMLWVNADYLGYVYFDSSVRKATQDLKPLLIDYPKSKAATCIFSMIVYKLLNRHYLGARLEERGLKNKVRSLNYESTYKGYRSGIGIYS